MKTAYVHLLLFGLLFAVVGCDHATKGIAQSALEDQETISIVEGALDLEYRENPGVAFNLERYLPQSLRAPLMYIGGVAALLFIGVAWRRRYRTPSMEHAAYALVLGGALGNLIDRVARGYVVDFIHVHHWPVFNVADIAICVGAGVLLVHAWRTPTPIET